MTNAEKVKELIAEADNYKFNNNCHVASNGRYYSRASVEMQAWIATCEDLIISNFGKESSPWRVFERFDRDSLDGNLHDDFNKQKNIIISALSSCLRISPKKNTKSKIEKELNNLQVFIVHGHDEVAKTKTARFVERISFEAIILDEQASSGKTIIEKIEEYSNVGFGIILYTPCDIGAKKNDKPKYSSRARQNVLFEHGFLIGKLGRSNVCTLLKDDVETPNDISGVVYINMDKSNAWMYSVAKEMKKAGFKVDTNKI